jgi:hypothetical protein
MLWINLIFFDFQQLARQSSCGYKLIGQQNELN